MKYIFMHNFRGFQETLVPIKDVNFLVGENSTGKTSLLGLSYLFHSLAFWVGAQFTEEEIEFGNYSDIVSMCSRNKKSFSVGSLFDAEPKEVGNQYEMFLMTFSNRGGMPYISRYTLITSGTRVDVKFIGTKVMYKFGKPEPLDLDDYSSNKQMFMNMVKDHGGKTSGFREMKKVGRSSIATINSVINSILEEETVKPRVLRFSWPCMYKHLTWIAPIRTKPQSIYTKSEVSHSAEGHHIPYTIKRLFDNKSETKPFKTYVDKFGNESSLFESLSIKKYGIQRASPFELDIVLSGIATNITNVGYGVSQVLPIVVDIFIQPKDTAFAIQQPEIHLHPRAQASIGDVVFELAKLENKHFLIETHSDYIIDRFRMNYRKGSKEKPKAQILYFEHSEGENRIYPIDIQNDGKLPSEQPPGFRDFFIKEEMRILGL